MVFFGFSFLLWEMVKYVNLVRDLYLHPHVCAYLVSLCLSILQISLSLEESVSTIASSCMSSSVPPLSSDLAPLLVAESDDDGCKKALKKDSIKLFIKSR